MPIRHIAPHIQATADTYNDKVEINRDNRITYFARSNARVQSTAPCWCAPDSHRTWSGSVSAPGPQ